MQAFFDERQLRHNPSGFIVRGERQPSPEVPGRATTLLDAVRELGLQVVAPPPADRALYARVHDPGYLEFLEHGHARWHALPNASAEIFPNVHPNGRM